MVISASRARIGWTISAMVAHLSSIFLLWRALHVSPAWNTPATGMFLVGLWSSWQAIRLHAVALNISPHPLRIAACVGSIGLLVMSAQTLVFLGAVETLSLAAPVLILVFAAIVLAKFGFQNFHSEQS